MRKMIAILLVAPLLFGCRSQDAGPDVAAFKVSDADRAVGAPLAAPQIAETDGLVLIEPIKADRTTIIEGGAPVEKYWAALTEEQRRALLDLTETIVQIEKKDMSGGITHPVGGVGLEKGLYRVSFTYMRYMNVPCQANDPGAGIVRVGIALEAAIEMSNNKKGLNIGSIIPVIVAAEAKKVSGNLQVRTVGITTSSAVLSGYMGQNLQLTTESLGRAMESLAVVKAVLEQRETITSANYLAFRETKSGACSGYVPRGTRTIGGGKVVG